MFLVELFQDVLQNCVNARLGVPHNRPTTTQIRSLYGIFKPEDDQFYLFCTYAFLKYKCEASEGNACGRSSVSRLIIFLWKAFIQQLLPALLSRTQQAFSFSPAAVKRWQVQNEPVGSRLFLAHSML